MPSLKQPQAGVWLMRLAWLLLPFAGGDVFAAALDGYDPALRSTWSVLLWVVWGVVALASWVTHPALLLVVRSWMPAGLAAALWAGVAAADVVSWRQVGVALVTAGVAAVVCLAPAVGQAYMDAHPYPSERRMLLRPPRALLVGPLAVVWAVAVAGLLAGPLLLAARQWVVGAVVLVAGFALSFLAHQSLAQLARRWLVFVPAGLVIHDYLTLGNEARLLETPDLIRIRVVSGGERRRLAGQSVSDPSTADLTLGALGAAVEFQLSIPCQIPNQSSRKISLKRKALDSVQSEPATVVLVAPSSLREVIAEADRRDMIPASPTPATTTHHLNT